VNVVDHGGPVLGSVEVQALFWNHAQADAQAEVAAFLADIVRSPFVDQLAEYSVGEGRLAGTLDFVPDGALAGKTSLTDSDIQAQLQSLVAAGYLQAGAQSLAMIFLPLDVLVAPPGWMGPVAYFEAYHYSARFPQGSVHYAVIRDPARAPDLGRFDNGFDFLTATASHELAEALTDPDVDDLAWFDDARSEIADICAWKSPGVRVDGYLVPRVWSRQRGACMAVPGPVDGSQQVLDSCWNAQMETAQCIDVQTDGSNCGGCGNRCGTDAKCITGNCQQLTPDCDPAICGPTAVARVTGAVTDTIVFPRPATYDALGYLRTPTGGIHLALSLYPDRDRYTEADTVGFITCYQRSSPSSVSREIWDVMAGQYGSFTLTFTSMTPPQGSLHADCLPSQVVFNNGTEGVVHLDLTF